MSDGKALWVDPAAADSARTPQQARFDALVRDVATWRQALADWQQRLRRHDEVVEPVRRQLQAAWREWVFALDAASLQPGLTRAERAQLSALLCEAATALLQIEDDDGELAAALQRHGGNADAAPRADAGAPLAQAEPVPDPGATADADEPWLAPSQAAAALRAERAAQRRAAQAQAQRVRQAQEVVQPLREVYRRLASALHPDREPDGPTRERKTVWMQEANQAYAQADLMALLELQWQVQQVPTQPSGPTDARRLQHSITLLQEQLDALQSHTRRLEAGFRASVGIVAGVGLQPRRADRLVSAQAQRLREELLSVEREARRLRDVASIRDWLREQRKR